MIDQAQNLVNAKHPEWNRLVMIVDCLKELQDVVEKARSVPPATRRSIDDMAAKLAAFATP